MVKSCFMSLSLASQAGAASAFIGHRGSSVTSVRSASHLPAKTPTPFGISLFSSASPDEERRVLQKRRVFLGKFAASSLVPFLASPAAVSARGFDEKGGLIYGADDIMSQKEHGTTAEPVQENLRYGVSRKLADKISSYNRVFAESGGYFEGSSTFERDVRKVVADSGGPVVFYDSVSGKPLFKAPVDRSVDEFIAESKVHGWPSFRDNEVVWDSVRVLKSSGETVSTIGTHLGHNLPDGKGNRYCINLVSISGNPESSKSNLSI